MGLASYFRLSPHPMRPRWKETAAVSGHLLILDISTFVSEPLEKRLARVPYELREATHILFRRLDSQDESNIVGGEQGQGILQLFFPRLIMAAAIEIEGRVVLKPIAGDTPSLNETDWIAVARQVEFEHQLETHDAVWGATDAHYVAPSGQHVERFIRLADVLGDPEDLARLADWITPLVRWPSVLLGDTPGILPLLQEIELRKRTHGDDFRAPIAVVPIYDIDEEEGKTILGQCLGSASRKYGNIPVTAIATVSSTGKYFDKIQQWVRDYPEVREMDCFTLCSTDPTRARGHVHARFNVRHYPMPCPLCAAGSKAFQIHQRSFMPEVMPSAIRLDPVRGFKRLRDITVPIQSLDMVRALAANVTQEGAGRYLVIDVATARALESTYIRASAEAAFCRATLGFHQPLCIVPAHATAGLVADFARSIGGDVVGEVIKVPLDGQPSPDIAKAIEEADEILLCDDNVITTRNMRAVLDTVQAIKQSGGATRFDIRAFAIIARCPSKAAWSGLYNRFYIGAEERMFAGVQLLLPFVPSEMSPWQQEFQLWGRVSDVDVSELAWNMIQQRMVALQHPEGLKENLFLGADLGDATTGRMASELTAGSYLGQLSDVGSYAAISSLFQTMRDDRGSEFGPHFIPSDWFFSRYTDPTLIGSILRAARPKELWGGGSQEPVCDAFIRLLHPRAHPMVLLEGCFAIASRRLPSSLKDMLQGNDYMGVQSPAARELAEVLLARA